MCMVVYLGSDQPLPSPPFGSRFPVLQWTEIHTGGGKPVRALTKPVVYQIHPEGHCGCWFQCEVGSDQDRWNSRQNLVEFLEWIREPQKEIELFCCSEGTQDSEPTSRDWATPGDFLANRLSFHDRELLTVKLG